MPPRSSNQFTPYHDQITALANQGKNTREILEVLDMKATKGKKEQLRRYLLQSQSARRQTWRSVWQ